MPLSGPHRLITNKLKDIVSASPTCPYRGPNARTRFQARPGPYKQEDVIDNLLPPWSKMYILLKRLRCRFALRAVPGCREAAAGDGEQVGPRWGAPLLKNLENLEFHPNPPGRVLGGLLGLWEAPGNPVGLEKLIDSMTSKLPPTTKFDLAPKFWRVRLRISRTCPRRSKKSAKNR